MKGAEIEVGKTYSAKIRWGHGILVNVIATAVPRNVGYTGKARNDGVKVVTAEPFTDFSRVVPAGTEYVISTRDVEHEWTEENQRKRDARRSEQEKAERRAQAIENALMGRGITGQTVRVTTKSLTLSLDAAEQLLGLGATT